jgi:hypothetical protein
MRRVALILALGVTGIHSTEEVKPLFGFSKSARVEIRENWDFSITAKFNEYAVSQDSMEIAFPYLYGYTFYPNSSSVNGPAIVFDSNYKAGFQVGFLLNTPYDKWNFGGEYEWFRSSTSLSKSAALPQYTSPFFLDSSSDPFGSFSSKWDVGIDLIDLYLARPFYSGKKITVEPFMGLRGNLIRQHFDLESASQFAKGHSNAWGVGPRLGANGNGVLKFGFSLFGNIATSLLYTRYTEITIDYADSVFAKNNNVGVLRPILESGLGVKWGRKNISFDVAYNFAVFFSQNMIKGLISTAGLQQAAYGNLYLQGVSVGGSIIF